MPPHNPRFWEEKSLHQMSPAEWESLCDGCGKCCLHKVEDEDTGEVFLTNVACRLLDLKTAQCQNYKHRKKHVPDCVVLTPKNVHRFDWLPKTCAYRLVAQGQPLPRWHHLVSGHRQTVHNAKKSVKGRCVSEKEAKDIRDFVVDWLDF